MSNRNPLQGLCSAREFIMQAFDDRSKWFRVTTPGDHVAVTDEKLRSIAYSMDTLVPGFYFWLGNFRFMIGGCAPDDEPYRYPGTIHSFAGIALVLPGYHMLSTYRGTHDPQQTHN